jgi:hypothetical protein
MSDEGEPLGVVGFERHSIIFDDPRLRLQRTDERMSRIDDAGFTEISLVQIGGEHQEKFTAWAERELLRALREL